MSPNLKPSLPKNDHGAGYCEILRPIPLKNISEGPIQQLFQTFTKRKYTVSTIDCDQLKIALIRHFQPFTVGKRNWEPSLHVIRKHTIFQVCLYVFDLPHTAVFPATVFVYLQSKMFNHVCSASLNNGWIHQGLNFCSLARQNDSLFMTNTIKQMLPKASKSQYWKQPFEKVVLVVVA